ncbi:hypothetical protein BDD12DRAFT_804437 [Trichophaea hybrida]|nr:hypothetical protein BDD12DRAFT_804437 [Trichophaea hybrida]
MHLTTTILPLFIVSVLAVAEPPTKVARSVGEPVCNIKANHFYALQHGVEPDGPMPDDFDEETDTYIAFSEGSSLYSGPLCNGNGVHFKYPSPDGWYSSLPQISYSVGIKGTGLDDNDMNLWLRGPTCDGDLRLYLIGRGPNCWVNLPALTCVNLRWKPDHHATTIAQPSSSGSQVGEGRRGAR